MMSGGRATHELAVTAEEAGERLDRFLARRLPELSRSRLQALIRDGHVCEGGATVGEPGARVKPGQTYRVTVPPAAPAGPAGEQIALAVVYEDEHLVVVDKPAGLVVHPAAGHASGTLVNALIAHCGASLSGVGGVARPGIVHRLDKDTSGLLVVAKTDAAHQGLAEQFAAHGRDGRLTRAYLGLCWRVPERPRGCIEAALARSSRDRTRIAVTRSASGRPAVTHYAVVERFHGQGGAPVAALLRLELETGRTHQIRVHLAHIGHPIIGDPVYSAGFKASRATLGVEARAALDDLGRQALHAAHLGFEHPVTGRRLAFDSPLPADFARLLAALRSMQ
ncbi:MAG: RluA family pseudouridine synthase [Pseudomonadota bacterium]